MNLQGDFVGGSSGVVLRGWVFGGPRGWVFRGGSSWVGFQGDLVGGSSVEDHGCVFRGTSWVGLQEDLVGRLSLKIFPRELVKTSSEHTLSFSDLFLQ